MNAMREDNPVDDDRTKLLANLERDGFAFVRNAVSNDQIHELRKLCSVDQDGSEFARRGDVVYGIRNLLSMFPHVRAIVSTSPFIDCATKVIGPLAKPIYGVYFDKLPGANWPIPWHQDITIRVHARCDVAGFEPRPVKDGTVHMLPPVEISEQILALRIHLDDAPSSHGALRVIRGSHKFGRLSNEQIERLCSKVATTICEAHAEDVMLMRPLLLHASSSCLVPAHRRVIHIEYASFDLPEGLEWHG